MKNQVMVVPAERIEKSIYLIRGHKVMLDRDLAGLYSVETKALKQAVRRNIDRFPSDFMFELSKEEFELLRSQIVTSSSGGTRYPPMAFTEQGVAMLSTVLRSKKAVMVNIEIMRAFVRLRELVISNKDLARKLTQMEKKYDEQFRVVFDAIRQLINPPAPKRRKIGFAPKKH